MEIQLPDKFKEWGITDFEVCECEEKEGLKSFYVSASCDDSKFLSMRYFLRKGIPDSVYFGCGVQAALGILREIAIHKEGLKTDADK